LTGYSTDKACCWFFSKVEPKIGLPKSSLILPQDPTAAIARRRPFGIMGLIRAWATKTFNFSSKLILSKSVVDPAGLFKYCGKGVPSGDCGMAAAHGRSVVVYSTIASKKSLLYSAKAFTALLRYSMKFYRNRSSCGQRQHRKATSQDYQRRQRLYGVGTREEGELPIHRCFLIFKSALKTCAEIKRIIF